MCDENFQLVSLSIERGLCDRKSVNRELFPVAPWSVVQCREFQQQEPFCNVINNGILIEKMFLVLFFLHNSFGLFFTFLLIRIFFFNIEAPRL